MTKRGSWFPWLVCGLGALFYCYEYMLRIAPSVMSQDLMLAFNIGLGAFGNLVAFYYYAYTPMQLPVGVMMDRYGPRRLLAFAALICAVGTYLFAHASLGGAQVGRFLVGMGSAFAFVGVLKLATLWLPPNRFAMIAGLATSLGMLGGMFGSRSFAHLVDILGWRATIVYSSIAGVVLAVCIWLFIPNKNKPEHGGQHTQSSMSYQQLFAEMLQLIKNPQMWLVGLVGFLLYLPISVFAELWGVPYTQHAYGLTTIDATDAVSTIFLGWAIGGPLVGWISDHLRKRRIPVIIGSLIAVALILIVLYKPEIAKPHLSWWMFTFGVFTSVQIIVFPIARELNLPGLAGTALAMTNMLVMIGGVLFQPLIGMLLDILSAGHKAVNIAKVNAVTSGDFQSALVILPVGILLAIIIMFFIKETNAKPRHVAEDNSAIPLKPAYSIIN